MRFLPKALCMLIACSLLLTVGCKPPEDQTSAKSTQESQASQSSQTFIPIQPNINSISTPTYAEGSYLPEGYTIDVSGFPSVCPDIVGNKSEVYVLKESTSRCFHQSTHETKSIPKSTPITAMFSLDPTGVTSHPMMLFCAYHKDIVEQTGKLQVGDTVYSRGELEEYLVYSDSAYEIYQIQPLVCGQPFTDCCNQLVQYARDMRNAEDSKFRDTPIKMESLEYLLEAYTYFAEHVTELIVPPQVA